MRMFLIAAVATVSLAGAANAQTVDQRHNLQQQRIEHGMASGRLTPGEAAHDEHQQASIDRQEGRMRARDDGHLTGGDRAVLQHRESNASGHIYRTKHNLRGR